MSGSRVFRLGDCVSRPAGEVLASFRDPGTWVRALGGTWTMDPLRWSWMQPRPGQCEVRFSDRPFGVDAVFEGALFQARVALTAVDAEPGTCTLRAELTLAVAVVIPGAAWVEIEREAGPRWLRALAEVAPAGTDPSAG